jgi:hypothetical protein
MTTRSRPGRRFLPSSPFNNVEPVPEIERYAVQDRVSHDKYGLGRVVGVDTDMVTVDFGSAHIRIASPFARMTKL